VQALGKPILEKIPACGPVSLKFREFKQPAFDYPWHQHPEAELTWILRGSGLRHVGDNIEEFGPGDCCLLGPSLPHTWLSSLESEKPCRSFVVQFNPVDFGERFLHMPEVSGVLNLLKQSQRGVHFGTKHSAQALAVLRRARTPLERLLTFFRVLDLLARDPAARPLSLKPWGDRSEEAPDPRIGRALGYIAERSGMTLSHSEAAKRAGLSPGAFSRLFRQTMGRTFKDYVTNQRIGLACRQLIETRRTISEIAYAVGFENISCFNRSFRLRCGMSPRDFRIAHDASS
jgi:AraC-like DNA-binding protein